MKQLSMAGVKQVPIDSIIVGERRRQKLGNLQPLMRSIDRNGLIHPIIVRNGMELVAGGRRLEACRKLKWKKIPVRRVESMTNEELRAVELDENIQRQPLTNYESAKARLAEIRQVEAKLKAETNTVHDVNTIPQKRKRGNPKKKGSKRAVAKETGIGPGLQIKMEQQVDYAERFPFLQKPEWNREQTLKAGKIVESFRDDEQTAIASLLDQDAIPPETAITILGNLKDMSSKRRCHIFELARSDDRHDRQTALTASALLPPPPDPGCLKLADAYRELERARDVCRNEDFKTRLERVAEVVSAVLEEFRKQVASERESFEHEIEKA